MRQNKKNNFWFLFLFFQKEQVFLKGGAIAPNAPLQLRHSRQ